MKKKIFFSTVALLVINTTVLLAQGLPCSDTDPDATCPLDSWVVVLAAAALLFAAWHLHRKQKSLRA